MDENKTLNIRHSLHEYKDYFEGEEICDEREYQDHFEREEICDEREFTMPVPEECEIPIEMISNEPGVNIRVPSPVDFFPDEPGVTDTIFIVEDRKIYVSKSVLIQASPVFKAMFTSEFKEKEASEIPLPGKKYETFSLFLRCILPKEYIELDEMKIADVLPLAHEYDVSSIKEECQWWLLNDIHIRLIKKDSESYLTDVEENIDFYVKCMYYGSEYQLDLLYKTALEEVVLHKASRYWDNEFYKMMAEKHKCELMETRVKKLEDSVENLLYGTSITDNYRQSDFAEDERRGIPMRRGRGISKTMAESTQSSIYETGSTLKVHSKYFL